MTSTSALAERIRGGVRPPLIHDVSMKDRGAWAYAIACMNELIDQTKLKVPAWMLSDHEPVPDYVHDFNEIRADLFLAEAVVKAWNRVDAENGGKVAAVIREALVIGPLILREVPMGPTYIHVFTRFASALDPCVQAARSLERTSLELNEAIGRKWSAGYLNVIRSGAGEPGISVHKRKQVNSWTRAQIWDKSAGRCWYCGAVLNPFDDFCVDHVIPVLDGGSNEVANLVPCCRACNGTKNAMPVERFRIHRGGGKFWFETRWESGR